MDDQDVLAARRGDHAAFERLAERSVDRLYRLACLILRDTHLAEDAVQEALVRAWTGIDRLREPDRFDAWLNRLVAHACSDVSRRTRRYEAVVRAVPSDPVAADGTGTIVDRDELERGFRRLTPDQRTVVVFHYYLDLPMHEVAEVLDVPVGTVKSRLHHARKALRAGLEADARAPVTTEVAR
jgi:RNA polymerase sigma-70 factor (ECF subfamily)